jgi:aldehyde:ferredoxin oxidoreductase
MKTLKAPNDKLYGYAGKILRINLTDSTTEIIPTSKYVPQYIGGYTVCNRIWWDEVKGHVGAFDAENKIIVMTGPTAATGLPFSGRLTLTGVSPNNLPEQYTHSSMGGFIGGSLKWAGYDGFIVEGVAPKPTYVLITNEKVEFLDATDLWGMLVHDVQEEIFYRHGRDCHSMVIGPAGENLHRNASITTNNDSVSAKSGFGAVFGKKKLKAIAVLGQGEITPAHPEQILVQRMSAGNPKMQPSPLKEDRSYGTFANDFFEDKDSYVHKGYLACGHGCNATCMATYFDTKNPFKEGETVTQVGKCLDMFAANYTYDCGYNHFMFLHSKRQEKPGVYQWVSPSNVDLDDPDLEFLMSGYGGDRYDLWGPSLELGTTLSYLCNQYGLDKWDMIIWMWTWLSMAKKEGLLDDLDFGMEVDTNSVEFAKHFFHMITYREGIGDIFAEGMARAVRKLGKEKYGDTIYHGRYNMKGEQLDIPISWEAGWGHAVHWTGRGYQGCPKPWWLIYLLGMMVDSRDNQNAGHFHEWIDNYKQYMKDPAHSPLLAQFATYNQKVACMKDTLTACEWKSPNVGRPDMERDMFRAATGIDDAETEDLLDVGQTGRLLYRAILMRDYGRCRDLEVPMMYPIMTYPDPEGETCTWDEWNDLVDLFYKENHWDLETGWPYRSTWEEYGLEDVADEIERLGLLPPEGRTEYVRKENPIGR